LGVAVKDLAFGVIHLMPSHYPWHVVVVLVVLRTPTTRVASSWITDVIIIVWNIRLIEKKEQ
jgi:hypothetical protein